MRSKKLKSVGNVEASAQHTFRERDTRNADHSRTHLNEHFGARSSRELIAILTEKLPEKRRSDAVLCIEHFFGASAEWWEIASERARKEFFNRSRRWVSDRYGPENVIYYGTQLDESTPHAVAYIVPLREGKLNAKSWLGGRKKMSEMQDSFADALEPLGLERGIRRSDATHEDVKRFYGTLQSGKERARELIGAISPQELTTLDELHRYARLLERGIEEAEAEAALADRNREVRVATELRERLGLVMAVQGKNYDGKIVALDQSFCIQRVVGIGNVFHQLRRHFGGDGWISYLRECQKDSSDVTFRYESGGATIIETEALRNWAAVSYASHRDSEASL